MDATRFLGRLVKDEKCVTNSTLYVILNESDVTKHSERKRFSLYLNKGLQACYNEGSCENVLKTN